MKINISNLILLVCTLFVVGCGEKDQAFLLEGNVEGYSNGTAYLKQFKGEDFVIIDSTGIENGNFTFSGIVDQVQLCRIVVEGYKYPIRYFFLEAGQLSYKTKVRGSNLTVPVVQGTPTQDVFNQYTSEKNVLYRKILALRHIKVKDKNEKKECQLQIHHLELKMMELVKIFIQKGKSPVLSLYLIKENYTSGNDAIRLANRLEPYVKKYAQHSLYKAIHGRVKELKRIVPGQPAPVFEMESIEGGMIKLSDFNGKIILLDFWASWCGPCRKENPNMVKLYNEFHNQGLEMIGISLDKDRSRWEKAVKKDNLSWNHVCDFQKWKCHLVKKYAVRGVPFTVLIDKEGKIIASGLHGKELKQKVEEALRGE